MRLGQSATTLSGGEAQRVKLSLELSKRDTGRTLYILDEPTTGLHFHDIQLLLNVLHRLRDAGNTRGGDRAQPGRDQDRRLGRSTSAPKAATAAAASSPQGTPEQVARDQGEPHRPLPDAGCVDKYERSYYFAGR